MEPEKNGEGGRLAGPVAALLSIIFLVALCNAAWVADNAYLTLRTAQHFVEGHGLTWNVAERVQVYDHPLWLFIVSGLYLLLGEMYAAVMMASIGLSLAAVALLCRRVAVTPFTAAGVMSLALSSRAFMDYSSSGLETPLSHFLLVLFFLGYFQPHHAPRALFCLALLAGLAALCDELLLLLLLPPLCLAWLRARPSVPGVWILAGFAPFFLWQVFAVFYYGFPASNTAYAAAHSGLPWTSLALRGFLYAAESWTLDFVTLSIITAVLVYASVTQERATRLVAAGLALYLGAVVVMGGHWMGGKLFAPAFLVALVLLSRLNVRDHRPMWVLAAMLLVLGVFVSGPDLRTVADAPVPKRPRVFEGITDARARYAPATGLPVVVEALDGGGGSAYEWPVHQDTREGKAVRTKGEPGVYLRDEVGFFAFSAGPLAHVVDPYGWTDPVLARFLAVPRPGWSTGRHWRALPPDHLKRLEGGHTSFFDQKTDAFREAIRLVTRGELWSRKRLVAIMKLHFGLYNSTIRPRPKKERLGRFSQPIAEGSLWNAEGNVLLIHPDDRLEVDLGPLSFAKTYEISVDCNDPYRIVFLRQGEPVAEEVLGPGKPGAKGMVVFKRDVPALALRGGFTSILVDMEGADPFGSVGHLTLRQEMNFSLR